MTQRNATANSQSHVDADVRKEINKIITKHLAARGISNQEAIRITGHSSSETHTYSKLGLVIKA